MRDFLSHAERRQPTCNVIDARERVRGELFRGTGNYHRIIVGRIHGERSAILNLHFELALYVCEQRIL
jgi:hypothetical protein